MNWIRFFVLVVLMIVLDFFGLKLLDAYNFKYFVVLHVAFFVINTSILFLFDYLKKHQSSYVGVGIMAGLIFKMFLALGIFVVLHLKLQLSNIQAINFMLVYFCYTIIFLIQVLRAPDLKI